MLRKIISSLLLAFSAFLIGCGSVSSSNNPTPTPTPTPVASPSPTPTPSQTADAMITAMVEEDGRNTVQTGTLTVDTTTNNGAGKLVLTGSLEFNAAEVLQFCRYPITTQTTANCLNLTSFTTDAKGAGTASFTFPQSGTFAGTFVLNAANQGEVAATALAISSNSFNTALLPAGTVTGGIQQVTGHAPGSGRVVFVWPTAHITLSGTTPNHTFTTAVCASATACETLSSITTDAQGNASADVGQPQVGGFSVFTLSDADGVEFISAFRVQ